MGGPTSQNTAGHDPHSERIRSRRIAVSLAGALAFLASAWIATDYVASSEIARTIDAHLTWLADPRTWIE